MGNLPQHITPEQLLALSSTAPELDPNEIEELIRIVANSNPPVVISRLMKGDELTNDERRCALVHNVCCGDDSIAALALADGRAARIYQAVLDAFEDYVVVDANPRYIRAQSEVVVYRKHQIAVTKRVISYLLHRSPDRTDVTYRLPWTVTERFSKALKDEFIDTETFVEYLKICCTAFSIRFHHPIPRLWVSDNWISQTLAALE